MNIPFLIAALEEAISDNRMAFLCQKFGVEPEFIVSLSQGDPTDGKYAAWILTMARNGKLLDYGIAPKTFGVGQRLGRIYSFLFEFARLSRKPGWVGEKDLMKYPDPESVIAATAANYGLETKGETNRRLAASGLVFMAEAGDLTLYRVDTAEAADTHLRDAPTGPQSPWCIKDNSHFEKYTPPFYYLRQKVGDDGAWQHYKLLHLPGEKKGYECRNAANSTKDASPIEFIRMGVSLDPVWESCINDDRTNIHAINLMLKEQPELMPMAIAYWVKRDAAVVLTNLTQTIASLRYDAALEDPQSPGADVMASSMLPPEAMEVISRNGAMVSVLYRWDFMPKERWPEAEAAVLQHPEHIATYWEKANPAPAPRWPEGEAEILANATNVAAFARYAVRILKQPWAEAEPQMIEIAVTDAVPPNENEEPWRYSIKHQMREIATYSAALRSGRWPELTAAIASAPWPQEVREYWLTKAKLV